MFSDVYIELHVPDFEKAIRFYRRLGFKLQWRTEDYLVMKRNRSVLNFYGGSKKIYSHSYFGRFKKSTRRGYGVEIILPVKSVDRLYGQARRFAKVIQPPQMKKWGRRDFRIVDPFGFYLRITEKYQWVGKLDAMQKILIDDYKAKLKERSGRRRR